MELFKLIFAKRSFNAEICSEGCAPLNSKPHEAMDNIDDNAFHGFLRLIWQKLCHHDCFLEACWMCAVLVIARIAWAQLAGHSYRQVRFQLGLREKEKEKANTYTSEFCFELWHKRRKHDWKNACFLAPLLGFALDPSVLNSKLLFIEVHSRSWNLKECTWAFDSALESHGVQLSAGTAFLRKE